MEGQKESPECSVYAVKNTRRLMEDRHVVISNLLSQFTDKVGVFADKYSYYAVFDGHAGPDAAQFAADKLHQNLIESQFFVDRNMQDAFREAFMKTDFQYMAKSELDGIKSGCTAVTCLLEHNKTLHIAWAGDSIALLSRNGKPYFITEPHNLERDDEKVRVEEMGGTVLCFDTWRVNGTLSVSRAIGDPEYKPYVCADPDYKQIELDGTEDFLIIGCDGLWDRMSPEDAIGLIYEHLQTNSCLEPSEIVKDTAKILADRAINDGSSDNVTTIVVFLRDVASILSTPNFVSSSESSNKVFGAKMNGDNMNAYNVPTEFNNISNSNNNNYDNGLIDTSEYSSRPLDNGLADKEVIGDTIGLSEESNLVSQLEIKSSSLNPFADEFQPNITNNIIEDQLGNEPKKDNEELYKNEGLEKKDLWMNEFKNDGNNEQHQQHYPNQAEMFDGLVVNGLSASESLPGSDENQPDLPSSQFEDNFLAEDAFQSNQNDLKQEPTAPELVAIEQDQFNPSETAISQAETFVGNLTPTEAPSSPLVTTQTTEHPSEPFALNSEGYSTYSFETSESNPDNNVNQYVTSVSDGMASEPYDPYFASDSVEPESIIVTTCDDVTSSGPHAIDPYSGDDKEVESNSVKDDTEVPLNQPLPSELDIEVTDNVPLESSNPFGSDVVDEPQAHLTYGLETKMPTDEEKSYFNEDNHVADNSSALLDFSADQVNDIVMSPYSNNERDIIEAKFSESTEQPPLGEEKISEPEVTEKPEELLAIAEETSKLTLQDESASIVNSGAPIIESNQTENITELIRGSTEEVNGAIAPAISETSKDGEAVATVAAAATIAAVSGTIISSKSSQPVNKESAIQSKTSAAKKSTAPLPKTPAPTRTQTKTTAAAKTSTTSSTSSGLTKPSTTRPLTTTLNRKPPTSTTTSGTSRISSLRTSSSKPSPPLTTGKPLARTTTTSSSALPKKPLSSTTTSGISKVSSSITRTTSSFRTTTTTTTTTTTSGIGKVSSSATRTTSSLRNTISGISKATSTTRTTSSPRTTTTSTTSTASRSGVKEADKKDISTGLTKPTTKRASTGSMLNRPSPGASSLTNKVSSSALNRSLTNSSRPGATTNSTVSKISSRPSTTSSTLSSTRSPGLSSTRTAGAKTSTTSTTKSTTSTNKVAVSRLGAAKKPTTATTGSKTSTGPTATVNNSSSITSSGATGDTVNDCNDQKTSSPSPVDATPINLIGATSNTISNSIKREKNMPNSTNSLKDELEAALASPISYEDKGVIKETKDAESSENL